MWFPEIWRRLTVLEGRVLEVLKLKRLLWTAIGMLAVDIFMGHRTTTGDQAINHILETITSFLGGAAGIPLP